MSKHSAQVDCCRRIRTEETMIEGSKILKGVYNRGDPPLPIPNREVKPLSADGTAVRWESRLAPNSEALITKVVRVFLYAVLTHFSLLLPAFFCSCCESSFSDVRFYGPLCFIRKIYGSATLKSNLNLAVKEFIV